MTQLANFGLHYHTRPGGSRGFHLEFLRPTYFELNNSRLQYIHIKLCDKHGRRLKLASGQATVLKFHLRRVIVEDKMNSHFIQVSSAAKTISGENKANKFSVQLPYTIKLHSDSVHGRWKVAISSAIIPSRFKLTIPDDFRILIVAFEDVKKYTIVLPHVSTLDDICNFLTNKTNLMLETEEDATTGGLRLKPLHHMTITMRSILYNFLGGAVPDIAKEPLIQIKCLKTKSFVFPRPPRFEHEFPANAFVYCNFVEPSICAGNFLHILRVLSLATDHKHGRHHLVKSFKNLEFHNVNVDELQTLSFELRSHDGQLINFQDEKSEVMFNLVFKRE